MALLRHHRLVIRCTKDEYDLITRAVEVIKQAKSKFSMNDFLVESAVVAASEMFGERDVANILTTDISEFVEETQDAQANHEKESPQASELHRDRRLPSESSAEHPAAGGSISSIRSIAAVDAPFGKSVSEFIAQKAPQVTSGSRLDAAAEELVAIVDDSEREWKAKFMKDFGMRVYDLCARAPRSGGIKGWDKMTWFKRYEIMSDKRDSES